MSYFCFWIPRIRYRGPKNAEKIGSYLLCKLTIVICHQLTVPWGCPLWCSEIKQQLHLNWYLNFNTIHYPALLLGKFKSRLHTGLFNLRPASYMKLRSDIKKKAQYKAVNMLKTLVFFLVTQLHVFFNIHFVDENTVSQFQKMGHTLLYTIYS